MLKNTAMPSQPASSRSSIFRVTGIGALPKLHAAGCAQGRPARASGAAPSCRTFRVGGVLKMFDTPVYRRTALPVEVLFAGPAIIVQQDSTTVVPPGAEACVHSSGSIIITLGRPHMTADQPKGESCIDPITAAVIQGALDNIAIEMGHKLMRMSYSSIIRESEDFGTALTDAQGSQLCECRMSTPLQSGPIPGYIRHVLKTMKERGDEIRPGDVMRNDPYGGASHGPDVAFCVPVFHRRRACRLLGHDSPSSRYRRTLTRELRHCRCRRHPRRGAAVQGGQSL